MARLAVLLLALSFVCPAHAQTAQPPAAAKAKPAVKPASPKAASAHPAASGPCIGVIPVIGDRFGVKKIGLTVFGNEFKEITVEKWGLDDLVVQRVQAAVGAGAVARRIAYAKGAFDAYRPAGGLFHNNDEKSANLIRQVAGPTPCERYVVVTKTSTPIVGNQNISGVGIVLTGGSFLTKPLVHAVVHVAVHDGRTFAVLKGGVATLNGNSPLMGGHQTLKLDDTAWPEPPEAANTPAIREATRKLLAGILDGSLPELLSR